MSTAHNKGVHQCKFNSKITPFAINSQISIIFSYNFFAVVILAYNYHNMRNSHSLLYQFLSPPTPCDLSEGEALVCTCFTGFNRYAGLGQGLDGGRGILCPEPWTTSRNWLKNSPSSMREEMGCWYEWTTLRRWGEKEEELRDKWCELQRGEIRNFLFILFILV